MEDNKVLYYVVKFGSEDVWHVTDLIDLSKETIYDTLTKVREAFPGVSLKRGVPKEKEGLFNPEELNVQSIYHFYTEVAKANSPKVLVNKGVRV